MFCHSKGAIAGGAVGGFVLLNIIGLAAFLTLLRHLEKKERRALEAQAKENQKRVEKNVVVENKGPVAGRPDLAEIVTSSEKGITTQTAPTNATGAAVVSTATEGVPGSVVVEKGSTVVVTAEHPVGEPKKAVVTRTDSSGTSPAAAKK